MEGILLPKKPEHPAGYPMICVDSFPFPDSVFGNEVPENVLVVLVAGNGLDGWTWRGIVRELSPGEVEARAQVSSL